MSVVTIGVEKMLPALVAGEPVPSGAVLQNARAHVMGCEIYGEEEIVEHFRRYPMAGESGGEARYLACDRYAALIWPNCALFAEISGEHILRLWRMGSDTPLERERQISVPFDADMMQARGDVMLQPSDHPGLNAAELERIELAGRDLAQSWRDESGAPALRARAFCIRAFSDGETITALFAMHVVQGTRERTTSSVHALAMIADDTAFIRDAAGEASEQHLPWRPRAV